MYQSSFPLGSERKPRTMAGVSCVRPPALMKGCPQPASTDAVITPIADMTEVLKISRRVVDMVSPPREIALYQAGMRSTRAKREPDGLVSGKAHCQSIMRPLPFARLRARHQRFPPGGLDQIGRGRGRIGQRKQIGRA